MPRYFMQGTRLAWAERMMMDPSRNPFDRSDIQRSRPQGKPLHSSSVEPSSTKQKFREGGV